MSQLLPEIRAAEEAAEKRIISRLDTLASAEIDAMDEETAKRELRYACGCITLLEVQLADLRADIETAGAAGIAEERER